MEYLVGRLATPLRQRSLAIVLQWLDRRDAARDGERIFNSNYFIATTMQPFTRFFVSQRFGLSVATVQMANAFLGLVWIRIKTGPPGLLMYMFDPKEFCATFPLNDTLAELILRCAIAQTHRAASKGETLYQARPLLPCSTPWLGDFHSDPDADMAPQINLRPRNAPDRRKGNSLIERSIATAIRMRFIEGRDAARSILQSARVPPSVIRRVLTNAQHRRRPGDRL